MLLRGALAGSGPDHLILFTFFRHGRRSPRIGLADEPGRGNDRDYGAPRRRRRLAHEGGASGRADGRSFMITVPAGATAGMALMVKVPRGLVEEPTATVPPADEPEPEVAMVRQGSMSAMHADTSELSSCFACCCVILSCYTVFPECLGCCTKGEVIQRRTVDRRQLRSTVVCLIMPAAINICPSRPLGHMHAR